MLDEKQGFVWRESDDGDEEDALPLQQALVALAIQGQINNGASITWQTDQQGEPQVALTNATIPLAHLGIHKTHGFFDKRQHPNWPDVCTDILNSAE